MSAQGPLVLGLGLKDLGLRVLGPGLDNVQYRRKRSKLVKITAGNHLAQPQSHLPEITGFIAPEGSQRRTLQIVPERELLSVYYQY